MKKFIILAIIFFLFLGAVGFWYWQRNPYSKEVLKLEILGPTEISLAKEVEYTVKYKNNGNVTLEEPRLVFEFPQNTITDAADSSLRKEIGSEELGDIYPGQEKTFKFKGRLFGEEDDVKTARVSLNYRPKGLKARYESATTLNTVIKSVPLTFDFDLSSKIEAGRDFKFSLNYFSSLDYPLSNLAIKVDYPVGFEFSESTPKALDKTEWEIPLLNKAEGGRIQIKGKITGDLQSQKIFSATLGIWMGDDFIPLKEITKGVEIARPLLSIFQQINGNEHYTADSGELLHYEIFFRNIGEEPFQDLFLVTTIDSNAVDFNTLKTDVGQLNRGDNSIMWDYRAVSKLKFLEQGEEGKVEFWVNLKKDMPAGDPASKNLSVKDKVLISQVSEEFETKVNSTLLAVQKGFYQDEVFGNTGPIPPKAGEQTTYTINWQAKNYYNDVKNVRVKAVLPQNVRLTGKIFPEDQASKFSFDNQSREIVWRISDGDVMPAGTGVINSPPSIFFQVALTPDFTQRGRAVNIINDVKIMGDDQWTGDTIESQSPAITTALPDDQNIQDHSGIVQ